MSSIGSVDAMLREQFQKKGISEFAFFSIARQGGRTALEILARALIAEGKDVYIGQNLTGNRSMGTNAMVARFSSSSAVPPGLTVTRPEGVMFMHEELVWPDFGGSSLIAQLKRPEVVSRFQTGTLMVCTAKSPSEVSYPIDFRGTVATVDAEVIFTRRVGISPAPSGITALGLLAAVLPEQFPLGALKQAVMEHERLNLKARQLNAACLEEACEKTKVVNDLVLPGKVDTEEYLRMANTLPDDGHLSAQTKDISSIWRESLPACEEGACTCAECLSADYCPQGAIGWDGSRVTFDYDFCKGCGVCAKECVRQAIRMRPSN